jgi:hypothetical protein
MGPPRRLLLAAAWALSGCAAEHVIGSRGLLQSQSYPGAASSYVTAAAVADFDGDGWADLALLNQPPLVPSELCLLTGDGSGALLAHPCRALPASWAIAQATAVRWQPQGKSGLAVSGERLALLGLASDGSWQVAFDLGLAAGATVLTARDLAADGSAELVVAARRDPAALLWPLGSDGRLGLPSRYDLAAPAQALIYQDLDGDGRRELATASGTAVEVILGGRGAAAVAACPASAGLPLAGVSAIGAIELSGHGIADLLLASSAGGGRLFELVAAAGPSFDCGSGTPLLTTQSPVALLRRDFDGDGAADLAVLGGSAPGMASPGELVLLRGRPATASLAVVRYPLPAAALTGAVGDLNSDGRPDVVALLGDGSIVVLLNAFY